MAPQELIDTILLYAPLDFSVALSNEYTKRTLLNRHPLCPAWMEPDERCLTWLMEYRTIGFSDKTWRQAVKTGGIRTLQYMYDMGYQRNEPCADSLMVAYKAGQSPVLQWLHERRHVMPLCGKCWRCHTHGLPPELIPPWLIKKGNQWGYMISPT